jgi:hypothetical protein
VGGLNDIAVVNFTVIGGDYVGVLVGRNDGQIYNCYCAAGSVTGNSSVGGLTGRIVEGFVMDSYSTCNVTGYEFVGGLVGYNEGGTVSNSFWDVQTSGQGRSAGGTGKTTAQMKSIATFLEAGWNIIAVANPGVRNPSYIWNIVDGQTCPFLGWED